MICLQRLSSISGTCFFFFLCSISSQAGHHPVSATWIRTGIYICVYGMADRQACKNIWAGEANWQNTNVYVHTSVFFSFLILLGRLWAFQMLHRSDNLVWLGLLSRDLLLLWELACSMQLALLPLFHAVITLQYLSLRYSVVVVSTITTTLASVSPFICLYAFIFLCPVGFGILRAHDESRIPNSDKIEIVYQHRNICQNNMYERMYKVTLPRYADATFLNNQIRFYIYI